MTPTPTATEQQRDTVNPNWHDKSYVAPPKVKRDFDAELRRCLEARVNDSTEKFDPTIELFASELYPAVYEIASLTADIQHLEEVKATLLFATADVINAAVGYLDALHSEGLL